MQTEITSNNKLASDLVNDTNQTNKFVTSEEKTQISTNATDIDALVEENSTLKKQQLKGQATGTSIQLTNSAEGLDIENVVIKGAMSQETRSGKNVLNQGASITSDSILGYETGQTTTRGGVQYVRNADKSISYSGTRTNDCTCIVAGHNGESGVWSYNNGYVLPAGTYKVVWENSESNNIVVAIWKYTQEGGYIGLEYSKTETNTNKSGFSTFTVDGETVILVGIGAIATYPTQSGTVKIMVVPNSVTDYTYEQYGAMPSIEFSSDINCVTGTNIVKVQNSDASLQQTAPLTLGNIKLYDGDKIQISFINKAGYKKVTGASITRKYLEYSFTGNETISLQGNSNGYYAFKFALENSKAGRVQNQYISNMFKQKTTATWDAEGIINASLTERSDVYIFVSENTATTVSEFKTKLSNWYANGTPMYIVYQLNELNTTPITDPTLLSQLETLINMKTYKQITNIEATGSDLAPVLEFQYSKDLQTVTDTLLNVKVDKSSFVYDSATETLSITIS